MTGRKKKNFGSIKVRVQLPSNDDQKAIVGGVEELLSNIEAGMATAMGNLILGEKSGIKTMSEFVSKANKDSKINTNLDSIKDYTEKSGKVFTGETYKKTIAGLSKIVEGYEISDQNKIATLKAIKDNLVPIDQKVLNENILSISKAITDLKSSSSNNSSSESSNQTVNVVLSSKDKGLEDFVNTINKIDENDVKKIANMALALNSLNSIDLSSLSVTTKQFQDFSNSMMSTIPAMAAITVASDLVDKSIDTIVSAFTKISSLKINFNKLKERLDTMNDVVKNINSVSKSLVSLIDLSYIAKRYNKRHKDLKESLGYINELLDRKGPLRTVFNNINKLKELSKTSIKDIYQINEVLKKITDININEDSIKTTAESLENINKSLLVSRTGKLAKVFKNISSLSELSPETINNLQNIKEVLDSIAKINISDDQVSVVKSSLEKVNEEVLKPKDGQISAAFSNIEQIGQSSPGVTNAMTSICTVAAGLGGLFASLEGIKTLKEKKLTQNVDAIKSFLKKFDDKELDSLIQATDGKISTLNSLFDGKFAELEKASEKAESSSEKVKDHANKALSNNVDEKTIQESKVNAMEIMGAIALGAMVMLIGGYILERNPELVKESLKFGAVLTGFLTMVMIPFALMGVIQRKWGQGAEIKGVGELVALSAAIMFLGGWLISSNPQLVKSSLMFGVVLMKFLALIMLPFGLMNLIGGKGELMKSADGVGRLVVKLTLVMLLGSLIFMIGGGKLVSYAMKFGVVLFKFLTVILLPLAIINLIGGKGEFMKSADAVGNLIIKCSIIMMIGALVVMLGGGKLMKAALEFGVVLGMFIGLIVAPFLVFAAIGREVDKEIKNVKSLIITCTFIMMIGAVFISLKNGKYVKHALMFGFVLMAFISLTLVPFLMFKIVSHEIFSQVKSYLIFLIATTMVMMVGAYIINKRKDIVTGAIKFGALLAGFMMATLTPFIIFKHFIKEGIKGIREVTIFIAISAIVLIAGAYIVKKGYGWYALTFAGILTAFTFGILAPFAILKKQIEKALPSMYSLSAFVAVASACLMIGALFIKKYGVGEIIGFAILLVGFIGLMGLVFVGLNHFKEEIMKGAGIAAMMGVAIGLLAIDMGIIHMSMKNMTLGEITMFVGAVAAMALVFGIIGIAPIAICVALGSATALAMAAALLTLSLAFTILHAAVSMTDPVEDFEKLEEAILNAAIVFGKLGVISPIILFGAIAGGYMGASLAVIGLAFGIVHFVMTKSTPKEDFEKLGDTIAVCGLVFTALGALSPLIVLGSIAGTTMGVCLTILTGAFALVHLLVTKTDPEDDWSKMWKVLLIAGGVFAALGAMSPLIALGSAVGALLSVALTLLSGAFALLHCCVAGKDLLADIKTLESTILDIALLCGLMLPLTITIPLATPALLLLDTFSLLLSGALLAMGGAIIVVNKIAKFNADQIKETITQFISITDAAPDLITFLDDISKAERLLKLSNVIGSTLGVVAQSVSDFAALKIPVKWDREGNPTSYRILTQQDFTNAASNVTSVVLTLCGAVNDIWTKHSNILGTDEKSPIYKVWFASLFMGKLLSTMCEAVKSYADLQIPIHWNKDGKPDKFRPMTTNDFSQAAIGVSNILTTLPKAIISVYTDKTSQYFTGGDKSPIAIVSKACVSMGEMIGSIARGLQSYAKLSIPTKWNPKTGAPIEFKQMKPEDFTDASTNISTVITTLSSSINNAYHRLPGGAEQIEEVIRCLMPMGELISSLAQGILDYSSLKIATEWDRKGNPVKYTRITNEIFKSAATNIGTVITSLAGDIAEGYSKIPGSPEKIEQIIRSMIPMGELISSLAEGIKDYAESKIAVSWDKEGHANKWVQLSDSDYVAAATTIGIIIRTLSTAIATGYKTINLKPDELQQVVESCKGMGDMVGSIAEGLQAYAKLMIPTRWNKEGKAVAFRQMDDSEFISASLNIKRIITTMGNAIMDLAKPGSLLNTDSDKFKDIVESVATIGGLIKDISEGLQQYATGMVANKWDKNGKAIHYVKITDQDYLNAAINITKIVTFMANTLNDLGKEGSPTAWMFKADGEGDGTPFGRIVESVSTLGGLIKDISEGVIKLATGMIPIAWNNQGQATKYRQLNDKDVQLAKTTLSTVITTVAQGLLDLTTGKGENAKYKWMFEDDGQGGTPFNRVVGSVSKLGGLIKDTAEGIQKMASGLVANAWNKDGKPISYMKLTGKDYDLAVEKIKQILTTVGGAVIQIGTEHPEMFDTDGTFKMVSDGLSSMGKMLSNVYEGVVNYAVLRYPVKWNNDGKAIKYAKMPKDGLETAKTNIINVITCLVNAITDPLVLTAMDKAKANVQKVSQGLEPCLHVLGQAGEALDSMVNLKIPTGFDKDGNAKGYKQLKNAEDIQKAGEMVKTILVTLPTAIENTYISISNFSTFKNQTLIDNVSTAISKLESLLMNVIRVVDTLTENDGIKKLTDIGADTTWSVNVQTIITSLANITKLSNGSYITSETFKAINDQKTVDGIMTGITNALVIIKTTLVSSTKLMTMFSDNKSAIDWLTKTDTQLIYSPISKIINALIGTIYENNKQSRFDSLLAMKLNVDNISEKLTNILFTISQVMLAGSSVKSTLKMVPKDEISYLNKDALLSIKSIINSISDIQSEINTQFGLMSNLDINKIYSVLTAFTVVISSIQSTINTVITKVKEISSSLSGASLKSTLSPVLSDVKESLDLIQAIFIDSTTDRDVILNSLAAKTSQIATESFNGQTVLQQLENFNQAIAKIVTASNEATEGSEEGFDIISNGLTKIGISVSKISPQQQRKFEANVKTINSLVTTVNKIRVQNMNSLTTLINAVNVMADKLGGVDKLADAIATALSSVLAKLVEELKHAEATIDDAKKLQERRHQLINASIEKVKTLMKDPLTVEVKAADEDNTTTTPEPTTDTTSQSQLTKEVTIEQKKKVIKGNASHTAAKPK